MFDEMAKTHKHRSSLSAFTLGAEAASQARRRASVAAVASHDIHGICDGIEGIVEDVCGRATSGGGGGGRDSASASAVAERTQSNDERQRAFVEVVEQCVFSSCFLSARFRDSAPLRRWRPSLALTHAHTHTDTLTQPCGPFPFSSSSLQVQNLKGAEPRRAHCYGRNADAIRYGAISVRVPPPSPLGHRLRQRRP